jgi:hypothetical protein
MNSNFNKCIYFLRILVIVILLSISTIQSAFAQASIELLATVEQPTKNIHPRVILKWKTPSSQYEFEIIRERIDGLEPPKIIPIPWEFGVPGLGPNQGIEQSFIDTNIRLLTDYRYKVYPVEKLDPSIDLGFVEVSIKGNELVIIGEQKLSSLNLSNPQIHRLKFEPESVLLTEGKDLVLNLIKLVSDKGKIVSFHKDTVAKPHNPGRHGGLIQITTLRAEGDLQILGRGEKGGVGKTGGKGATGAKGGAGLPGRFVVNFKGIRCEKTPGDGENGKPGHQGERGGDGYRGGDSSEIFIQIIKPTTLNLNPQVIPGQGGDGGRGGLGGDGGPGGEFGLLIPGCQPAKVGAVGPTGTKGVSGNKGPNGKEIKPVLTIINI